MSCTGNRNPISHPDHLVIPGRVRVSLSGRFRVDDDPDRPGTWSITGRFTSPGRATGKLKYSRGTVNEFCTTFDRTWSATRKR
jgi:hypothetical protein